ncbi:MAG TPA: hypothetical protein ENI79_07015 [Rhodospirillales bacterium]|nr:hypothetical protein [Rhodospirillales bacterium]
MIIIRTFLAGLFAGLILVLGACDTFSSAVPPPPCPRPAIYAETANVTKFREGPGRDLIDVVAEGKIIGFSGGCNYDFDEETGEGVLTVEISVDFEAHRGTANKDRKAKFDYFISVTDQNHNVLSKGVFDVDIEFPGNRTRAGYTDDDPPVNLEIPLQKGQIGEDFNILIGFQLSNDELTFNRRQRKISVGPSK